MKFHLSPLGESDFSALLSFETRNRGFFERWVPPRPVWFFEDLPAYTAHMHKLMAKTNAANLCMYIMQDSFGDIVGRLNLTFVKGAHPAEANIGYRVAEAHIGKGLASWAILQAGPIAAKTHKVQSLSAFAARNNLGSTRTLEKAGFVKQLGKTMQASLHGNPIFLQRYYKTLP